MKLVQRSEVPSERADARPTPDSDDTDLEGLVRPLLGALCELTGLEMTYLTVFDWPSREQSVLFSNNVGTNEVEEGMRLLLPHELNQETLAGVTRSPQHAPMPMPDGLVAKRLGFKTHVSVPITLAGHELFGMLCGASRASGRVGEVAVSVMESFAGMIGERVSRNRTVAVELRASIAEEQLRQRARYFAMAEHELKTHLTVLEGASLLLRDRWADIRHEQRSGLLGSMVRKTREMSLAVERLLIEARSEVSVRELHPIHLDLTALARSIVESHDALGGPHAIVLEAPGEIDALMDPMVFTQVLGHLLDNAIKYSPEGGRISVSIRRDAQEIEVVVADEGIGLPQGVDIFEPFSRGKPKGDPVAGIGLGLHIVRSLVGAMSGRVSAKGNSSQGSTFVVRLPA